MAIVPVDAWHALPHFTRPVNRLQDVVGFIHRWDNGIVARRTPSVLSSQFGNINNTGAAARYSSPDLAPHDSVRVNGELKDWHSAIEPRVRNLVLAMIWGFDCITYSSCQGHLYFGVADAPQPHVREVQVLPRSRDEANCLAREITAALSPIACRRP